MPSLCFIPSEYLPANFFPASASPIWCSRLSYTASSSTPNNLPKYRRFSIPDISVYIFGFSISVPTSCVLRSPEKLISPESTGILPAIALISVVLPAPLPPNNPMISPVQIDNDTSSNTVRSLYFFVT